MKILYMEVEGLKYLNGEKVVIDYLCNSRVSKEQIGNEVTEISKSIYINNVIAFTGINASGKTTILKLQQLISNIIFREDKLSTLEDYQKLLNNELAIIKTVVFINGSYQFYKAKIKNGYFYDEEGIFYKKDIFKSRIKLNEEIKSFSSNVSKLSPIDREIESFKNISKEISILGSLVKKSRDYNTNLFTNYNYLGFIETPISLEIIKLLDESIEYIKYIEDDIVELKFYNQDKKLGNTQNIAAYLSSGTIKGITLFERAYMALVNGTYFWVDEIELNLHKTIVIKIIELFTNNDTNPYGATLVFTTHYTEILDEIDRHDAIYILQKDLNKVHAARMSDLYKRNDVKNSRLYLSGALNSAPSYENYILLKRALVKKLKEYKHE